MLIKVENCVQSLIMIYYLESSAKSELITLLAELSTMPVDCLLSELLDIHHVHRTL